MSEEKRRVEFTEKWKEGSQEFEPGDRMTFYKPFADQLIEELGVAKDPDTGEQGERKPGSHKLKVNSVSQEVTKQSGGVRQAEGK